MLAFGFVENGLVDVWSTSASGRDIVPIRRFS
jgi:hypothetical protein